MALLMSSQAILMAGYFGLSMLRNTEDSLPLLIHVDPSLKNLPAVGIPASLAFG